jgi:hypothetical protein
MKETIKTLKIENARLYRTSCGNRNIMADFEGTVEITQEQTIVPILGRRCRGEKRILASVILCEDVRYLSMDIFSEADVYDAAGTVTGENSSARITFSGLRFEDNDPISGKVTFEVTDLHLIESMLKM